MKTTIETLRGLASDIQTGNENYAAARTEADKSFYKTWTQNKVKSFNRIEKEAAERGETVEID